MPSTLQYLAIDLGAESGRAMLGQFDERRLALTEAHRFPNMPVRLPDGLHWDVLRLWAEIRDGVAAAARKHQTKLSSVGLDTWGVDFGLLDRQGCLLGNPQHPRYAEVLFQVLQVPHFVRVCVRTGIHHGGDLRKEYWRRAVLPNSGTTVKWVEPCRMVLKIEQPCGVRSRF